MWPTGGGHMWPTEGGHMLPKGGSCLAKWWTHGSTDRDLWHTKDEDSPQGAIVSTRGHDAILIHCHAVDYGLLILQHVVQELALQGESH